LVSVDTSTARVMQESAEKGAGIINDVRALQRQGALEAAAKTGLPVCLMHMQGEPDTMQKAPQYKDVVEEVSVFLTQRIEACKAHGIDPAHILIDPGFGFGKTLTHNLSLLQRMPELAYLGCPILVGLSRKSLLQQLLGRPVHERLAGSLALALAAVQRGASIIRVHDVAATRDVLTVLNAIDTQV
jgi:dihydropteroate synthase